MLEKLKLKKIIKILLVIILILMVSSVAYSSVQSGIKKDDLLELTLEELMNIEISTATKTMIPIRKAPATATVITAREIQNMGARNLTDVIRMVPGMGITRSEQGYIQYETRGIKTKLSEKILVLIDGHSLNKNFVGSAIYLNFNQLPINNIKQIEIIKGPGSALYGANAFLSVINIITRDPEEIDGSELTTSYGSFETERINYTGGKLFNSGIKISGSADYYKTNGAEILIEKDVTTGTSWASTPGYADLSDEESDIFVKAAYGDFSYNGHYSTKRSGFYIGLANALISDNDFFITTYWNELSHKHSFSDKLTTNVKVYFDHFQQGGTFDLYPNGYLGSFPDGLIGGPELKNDTLGTDIQVNYELIEKNILTTGVAYERFKQYDVRRRSNYTPAPSFSNLGDVQDTSSWLNWNKKAERETMAVFLQDEWDILDNLFLTTGVRYDNYSDFGDTINPRTGIVWNMFSETDLKLTYGRAFRVPDFGELYTDNNVASMGNQDLKPETIETYEIGIDTQASKTIMIGMNYFSSKINDIIKVNSSVSPAMYDNLGKAKVRGLEFIIKGQYNVTNYWNISYLCQDPRDGITDHRLPDVPVHRATASFNHGLTKYLNLHLDLLWTGARARAIGDSRGSMESYTVVDLALNWKSKDDTFEVQTTIHNLFDYRYKDPDTSGASMSIPGDYPREGIAALVNVKYKF